MPTEPPVLSASTVLGNKIQAIDGTDLGKIRELIIEPNTGHILRAVLSTGLSESAGELFSVPWNVLKPAHVDGIFYLDSENHFDQGDEHQNQAIDEATPIVAYTTSIFKPRKK